MIRKTIIVVLAAAMFVGSGIFVAPRPAQADTNSTIAIAAAAIIGLLAFDEYNRPYYVRDGYRCYVPDDVAFYYFQNYYPGWYGDNYNDWYYNRARFAYNWNHHNGYGYNGGGYYNGGDRRYESNYTGGYQRPVNYERSYNTGYQGGNHGYQPQSNNYRGGYQPQSNNYRGGSNQGNHNDRSGDHHWDHGH